ncbi:hypothetical protein LR48_Vigan01g116400 [Vigna angularis]|uniref:Uncharacterized protein n=1 Tax=Phaseolus angularis TaxID=3914 RepID=A0A0L9TN67_PHAAN|nr:hypothetical protein LR48_Vigan01g116400 [Vigna angularis]
MGEVENAIDDGDDSAVGEKQKEERIEEKGGVDGLWWKKAGRVFGEEVKKVRDSGREEEEEGEGEEEDEIENVEVTRMWFDDELNFRNEVQKALLGSHIGRREERRSEVARLL